MNLSAPFILRPIMTTLLMLSFLLAGIWAYFNLPISNMPNVEFPTINVLVNFPGANPETMANTVATPLEKEFLTIDGLISVASSNILGSSTIVLQFALSKNIDVAAQDVQAAIARATPNLPPQLPNAPTYRKVNPSLTPIIILALTSDTAPLSKIYDFANNYIAQQITLIEGVAQVLTYGFPFAVRVQMDPGKLATTNVTLLDVSDALFNGNPFLPTGFFDGKVDAPTILVKGQLVKADEYNPLIVKYINNAPLRVQDLGKAVDSLQNYRYSLFYVDPETKVRGVALAVLPGLGSNAVQISKRMHELFPSFIEGVPKDMDLRIINDKTTAIHSSIFDVKITLLISFVLIVIIIFLYLGRVRETIIPALVLPLSVIGTFAFMYLFGFNMDNLSLMALILASGFVIDDAIVVIENIVRHAEEGKNPWDAAMEGSKEIGFTIVSMTLSLVAVFIPLLFMGGLFGKIVAEFAFTLTTITVISGVISLTLTPMLCSLFITKRNDHERKTFVQKIHEKMLGGYKKRLKWILDHRPVALIVLFLSIFISLLLLIYLPKDFIPSDDVGFLIGYTQGVEGISSQRMMQLQDQVSQIVRENPHVDQFVSVTANQLFRNGILYVRLKPRSQRPGVLKVIDELRKKTDEVVGINVYYKNIPLIDLSVGTQVKGAYQYVIKSFDSEKLYEAAAKFIEKMRTIEGLQGVNSDLEINTPQVYVDILRDKAYSLGVNATDIERTFQLAYSGGRVSRIQTPLNQYDVILELQPRFQRNANMLNSIYVRSNISKEMIPLNIVSRWHEGRGTTSINHTNQFPSVTVSFNLTQNQSLGNVLKQLNTIARETLPAGVTGEVIGAAQSFQQSIRSSMWLLIVTFLVIYIVLGMLYESYIHPLTIITTLPPAILGGLLGLWIFNYTLSFYSFLGIILLIGIVKKNGIMMVDFALENRRQKGLNPHDAIYEAALTRFRPIMMTTMAAIMGALPLVLGWGAGADARRPLGVVVIAGLLVSQLITLFVTPVIYLYLDRLDEKIQFRNKHVDQKV